MDENQKKTDEQTQERPSSTSPLGGKTHEATKPPGQGNLDKDAAAKSREGLEQAGGGH